MNFQTLSKQRKFVLIAAAVGIIGIFCPWVSLFGFSVNGFRGVGILIFICLLAALVIALMGDQTKSLDKTNWMIALLAAALAAIIMVINFFNALGGELEFMSFGFYLTLLGTLATLAATFMFRAPGDNIKDGFDSLKKDIGSKMNSSNTNSGGTDPGANAGNTNPPL